MPPTNALKTLSMNDETTSEGEVGCSGEARCLEESGACPAEAAEARR